MNEHENLYAEHHLKIDLIRNTKVVATRTGAGHYARLIQGINEEAPAIPDSPQLQTRPLRHWSRPN